MFKIYQDSRNEYRWRFLSANNRIIADSAEGYRNKADCQAAIDLLKRLAPLAQVMDETVSSGSRQHR